MKRSFILFFAIVQLYFITNSVFSQSYCTPPKYYSGPFTGILKVEVGAVSNSTQFSDGYSDYYTSVQTISLTKGSEATINIDLYYDASMLSYFLGDLNIRVWIDWNQNFIFDEPSETVVSAIQNCRSTPASTRYTANFTVPANATAGKTRMRVFNDMAESDGHDTPNPCGYLNSNNSLGQHGECEDYSVNVVSGGDVPLISLNKTSIDFDTSNVGVTKLIPLEISNTGTSDLEISDITINNDDDGVFAITGSTKDITITPNNKNVINITLNPKTEKDYSANLTISSNDTENSIKTINLTGTGYSLKPKIETVSELKFGDVNLNDTSKKYVIIKNSGGADLDISAIIIDVIPQGIFFIQGVQYPITISPAKADTLTVSFNPKDTIAQQGSMIITSNDPNLTDYSISLTGKGVIQTDVNEELTATQSYINIEPNPVNNNFLISLPNSDFPLTYISIINSVGMEVKRLENSEITGKSIINVSSEELNSGVYYCILKCGTRKISKMFVVVK